MAIEGQKDIEKHARREQRDRQRAWINPLLDRAAAALIKSGAVLTPYPALADTGKAPKDQGFKPRLEELVKLLERAQVKVGTGDPPPPTEQEIKDAPKKTKPRSDTDATSKPGKAIRTKDLADRNSYGPPDENGWQHMFEYTGKDSLPPNCETENRDGTIHVRRKVDKAATGAGSGDKKQPAGAPADRRSGGAALKRPQATPPATTVPVSDGGVAIGEAKDIDWSGYKTVRVELPTDDSIGSALAQYDGKKVRVVPTNETLPTLPGAVREAALDCSEVKEIDCSIVLPEFKHHAKTGTYRAEVVYPRELWNQALGKMMPAPPIVRNNVFNENNKHTDDDDWYAYETAYRAPFEEDQPESDLYIDGEPCTFGPESAVINGQGRNGMPYWWANTPKVDGNGAPTEPTYVYLKKKPQGEVRLSMRNGGMSYYNGDDYQGQPATNAVTALCNQYSKGNKHSAEEILKQFMNIPVDVNFTLANAHLKYVASDRDSAAVGSMTHRARGWRLLNSSIKGCAGHGWELGFDCHADGLSVTNAGHNAFHPYGGAQELFNLLGHNINWKANSWGWGASLIKFYPQLPFTRVLMNTLHGTTVFANVLWFDFLELVNKIELFNINGEDIARDFIHDEISNKMILDGFFARRINYLMDSVANGYSGAAARIFNAPDAVLKNGKLLDCLGGGVLGYNLQPVGDPDVGFRQESGKTGRPGGKAAYCSNLQVDNVEIEIARDDFNMPHRDHEGSMKYGMTGVLNDLQGQNTSFDVSKSPKWTNTKIIAPGAGARNGTPWAVGHPHASDKEFEEQFMGSGSKVVYRG